jgi:hypothetical protein
VTGSQIEIGDDGQTFIAQGRKPGIGFVGPNDAQSARAARPRHIHQGRRRQFRAAPIRTVATLAIDQTN